MTRNLPKKIFYVLVILLMITWGVGSNSFLSINFALGYGGSGPIYTPPPASSPAPTPTTVEDEEEIVETDSVLTTEDGNLNSDEVIDDLDFSILMNNWGGSPSTPIADLNSDGFVDDLDFSKLMANWS